MRYQAYNAKTLRQIPQIERLTERQVRDIEVVSTVFPFKVNNYVLDNLIEWDNFQDDPIFRLTFPQRGMLLPPQFEVVEAAMGNPEKLAHVVEEIRESLNPHPAGQMLLNVPMIEGHRLTGLQHKYRETVLFFPGRGQTCHAYCTFCFRWPQFVGMDEMKFGSNEADLLVKYLQSQPEVTDLIFTGGDPMVMKAKVLASYVRPILEAKIPHLRAIRIGSKALAYWPQRFLDDPDADELFALFEEIKHAGKHLALMAHFNHPKELSTPKVAQAIERLVSAGIQIRTQSPLIRGINDSEDVWASMWRRQMSMDLIPYYMFVERDTGAQHYFAVPLVEAWSIFKNALQKVSGIARTVRGPSMSCTPGKIEVVGVSTVKDQKVIVLRMIQARNPDWVLKPFFAEYDEKAVWIDQLKPAFGEKSFFFEPTLPEAFHFEPEKETTFHRFHSDH